MTEVQKIVAVDFDGTVVTHEYPDIGSPVAFAGSVLQDLVKNGCKVILWTMRSGEHLEAAVAWFAERQITLWGINENPDRHEWTTSRKVYAQIYIDDAAAGCPTHLPLGGGRPYVNWVAVRQELIEKEFLPNYGIDGETCSSASSLVLAG